MKQLQSLIKCTLQMLRPLTNTTRQHFRNILISHLAETPENKA